MRNERQFQKVLVVSKMTRLEANEIMYGSAVDDFNQSKKVDVEGLARDHTLHYRGLDMVMDALRKNGINPGIIKKQAMGRADFKEPWDLIIPVGGDGTFMDVSRYVLDDTPIFGVKSSPNSVGGHYNTNFSNAEKNIKRLLEGDYYIKKRARVKGVINNGLSIVDHALNEIFIGDLYNAGYAYLDLYLNGQLFKIGASGMVVSTYNGKTGWYDNIFVPEKDPQLLAKYKRAHEIAGLPNAQISCLNAEFKSGEEQLIRYKVREVSKRTTENFGYTYGIIKPGDEFKVISTVLTDGAASFDGSKPNMQRHRSYKLEYGNEVLIQISDKPLSVVEFD